MEATREQVENPTTFAAEPFAKSGVTVEWLAYIGLAILALVLRVAELDSLPLNDVEARHALHAWHSIEDNAPGSHLASNSPLAHIGQLIGFSLLGANAFSARLFPMLAGWLLTLAPLLFRDALGRTRAFVWACLLSLLTLPIASSRLADGTSFMMLFALLSVWMIRCYWYSRQVSDARWAVALVTVMTLLSAPAGLPLLAVMLLAGWLAVWRTAISAPQRLDLPGDDILKLATRRLRAFPLADAAFVPFAVVILAATLFMLHPGGLRTVGALIEASVAGVAQPAGMDSLRLGFAALFAHETLLVVFALGGAWLLWRQGAVTYIDRFAAAWACIGALALLLYPGASAADAMWVALPLTLLASYGVAQLMVDRRVVLLWDADEQASLPEPEDNSELYTTAYWWVKWLIAGIVFALLLVICAQFMEAGRLMNSLPESAQLGELLSQSGQQAGLLHALGMMTLLSVALTAICLLLANYWGAATTLQGTGLGFLGLMLLSGAGGGWSISAADPANPNGLWRQHAISGDVKLLQDTLHELSLRRADGFASLPLAIVEDPAAGINRDGLVAWLLREYPNARFVPHPAQASDQAIVLTADDEAQYNQLSGDYVGQRFLLRRSWSVASQSVWDLPGWWTQNRRRDSSATDDDAMLLWLRQDIYDGTKLDETNDPSR